MLVCYRAVVSESDELHFLSVWALYVSVCHAATRLWRWDKRPRIHTPRCFYLTILTPHTSLLSFSLLCILSLTPISFRASSWGRWRRGGGAGLFPALARSCSWTDRVPLLLASCRKECTCSQTNKHICCFQRIPKPFWILFQTTSEIHCSIFLKRALITVKILLKII